MKIIAFSINPLFPKKVMGGAPKHLQNIAIHLGELGHEVTVLATQRDDSRESFYWHERVQVKPILRFNQPFPQPYATPAYNIAAVIQDVGEHLEQADRFYMHDGEFLFPYAYRRVPTVVSLRDNVYPETLLGGFLFQSDRLIVISDYARQFFLQTVGRFFPDLGERIRVIHNGLDWGKFKPTPPGRIFDIVKVDPAKDTVIVHPHRPEESKGIRQTVAVADRLVNQYQIPRVRVLVPRWLDLRLSADVRAFYSDIEREIAARGLTENFVFHDWVPQELMPEYYSLGRVTLALGSFVESFGNAVYESYGCGTPAIAARISSHRELLPEHLAHKVDFDDTETAAAKAAEIIRQGQRTSAETAAYLKQHYSIEGQVELYAQAILNAKTAAPLNYQLRPINEATRFGLPVWCFRAARGIYNDFRAEYRADGGLDTLCQRYPQGFTLAEAGELGMTPVQVMDWYRDGYFTPV